ncbi:translocation/assembly module TamB domain-containing protein [Pelobacter seleniigenes]|uniref:translocation/assembly module TamB domain-containing protein n=1 Tax=Pelobacter seleniigenes TaxID=407188 RepID=UPI0004A72727|nr:translocation/assembly module TamB domain-containing protein [Pelobacter seleniigenes]
MVRLSVILAGLILVTTAMLAGCGWLFNTAAGTRWLVEHALVWSGQDITVGQIDGTLLDSLELGEVRVNSGTERILIDRLSADSRLIKLWPLHIRIATLELGEVRLVATEAAPDTDASPDINLPSWPLAPGFVDFFDVEIDRLTVHKVVRVQSGGTDLLCENLQTRLRLQNAQLRIDQLSLQTPPATLTGSAQLNLAQPDLKTELSAVARQPSSAWQQVHVDGSLNAAKNGAELSGPVMVRLTEQDGVETRANGTLTLAPQTLILNDMAVHRSDRQGTLGGSIRLSTNGPAPQIQGHLLVDQVDLEPEAGRPLKLSGDVLAVGNLDSYSGHFTLNSAGPELYSTKLKGRFQGSWYAVTVSQLDGSVLNGQVTGTLRAAWNNGLQLQTTLTGTALDPELLWEQLSGQLNVTASAEYTHSPGQQQQGQLEIKLAESTLQQKTLQGQAKVSLHNEKIMLEILQLHGEGVSISATGNPAERLQVTAKVADLSAISKDAGGRLTAAGWVQLQAHPAADLTVQGENLFFQDWALKKLALSGKITEPSGALKISAELTSLSAQGGAQNLFDEAQVQVSGALNDHSIAVRARQQDSLLALTAGGSWDNQQWLGTLHTLHMSEPHLGEWDLRSPASVTVSPQQVQVDAISLQGGGNQRVKAEGNYSIPDHDYAVTLSWQDLNLTPLEFWLPEWTISGSSSGQFQGQQGARNSLQGEFTLMAEVEREHLKLTVHKGEGEVLWNGTDISGRINLNLAEMGSVQGRVNGKLKDLKSLPSQLQATLSAQHMPLAAADPWLPPHTTLTGSFGWDLETAWTPAAGLTGSGTFHAEDGQLSWPVLDETINIRLNSIAVNCALSDVFSLNLTADLGETGQLSAQARLPLKMTMPPAFDRSAAWNIAIKGEFRDQGLVEMLAGDWVQDTAGIISLDYQMSGSYMKPLMKGSFQLSQGAAFIPRLGIKVNRIELAGLFDAERISVTGLSAEAGEGKLTGDGYLTLKNWRPKTYHFNLTGERFQLFNLPELQVAINPDLEISGTERQLKVRGEVLFPDVLVRESGNKELARNSPDLVIVDRQQKPSTTLPLTQDIDIKLVVGERVLVDFGGIEAKLDGQIRLTSTADNDYAATGKIAISKGKFSSYGVSLDITRGDLYFAGGPLQRPILDILALRTVGEVKAGVKVSGTAQNPVVTLYSEPSMADTDILSYMVLGRPLDSSSGGDSNLLMSAAGALLSQGESVVLQEKLKGVLGLDVLTFSAGNGNLKDSVLTTGKYLSPDLYVSLGYSVFKNTNEFTLRYHLTPKWEVESNIGEQSGVDLFYRIEIE